MYGSGVDARMENGAITGGTSPGENEGLLRDSVRDCDSARVRGCGRDSPRACSPAGGRSTTPRPIAKRRNGRRKRRLEPWRLSREGNIVKGNHRASVLGVLLPTSDQSSGREAMRQRARFQRRRRRVLSGVQVALDLLQRTRPESECGHRNGFRSC